jgi:serine/threonine protein kinase
MLVYGVERLGYRRWHGMGISRVRRSLQGPANILVKDGQVLIADFGIAKNLIDEETTRIFDWRRSSRKPDVHGAGNCA